MALRILPVDKRTYTNPAGLAVHPSQEAYVCRNPAEYVRGIADDTHMHCFEIRSGDQAVGFFVLDTSPERARDYVDRREGFCVLKSFLIDKNTQGSGFARQALEALPGYVRETLPGLEEIYLTVNYRNDRAIALYEKNGFRNLDRPYLGGLAGPQHTMVMELHHSASGVQVRTPDGN